MVAVLSKISERSPLKYLLVRCISYLSLMVILSENAEVLEKRISLLLDICYKAGRITAVVGDAAKMQCQLLYDSSNSKNQTALRSFHESDRLDVFYSQLLNGGLTYADLFSVIILILILSHGNESVESEFSVNKATLVENLAKESLVVRDWCMTI